jgi:ribosomal protein S18 acetylase RimI-like enzyme
MLGLWTVGSAPLAMRLHVAFAMALDEVLAAPAALTSKGVQPLSFFGRPADEPSVIGWMAAAAVYFEDPDGHLLEYLAMLDEAPRHELGIVSWSQYSSDPPSRRTVRVREHDGARAELRWLFELAEDSAEQLDASIDGGRVLVAVDGDRAIGHIQVVDTGRPGEIEIKNMAVDTAHQRRGVGRALVAEAVAAARQEGRSRVVVATAAADVGNLRFYQRLGFRMRLVEPDAFTAATGYAPGLRVDGIELRDRVWLDLRLTEDGTPSGL